MRVLINTVPLYGRGEGVRTYTTQLLRALHATDEDMDWHLALHAEDAERLGIAGDARFHLTRLSAVARPPKVPVVRFAWWNMLDQLAIPRTCKPTKYDLVHYLDSYGPAFQALRIPLALTVHDVIPLMGQGYYAGWIGKYLAILMRRSILQATAIMAVSDATAQTLTQMLNIPPARITVAANGVDERFRPTTDAERAAVLGTYNISGPYVITVGTIEPRKNLARLVRAFAQAKHAGDLPHQLLIVGKPGWKIDDVTAAIEDVALGPAIRLLGFVPHQDIALLIGGADVLAYPSLEEGFGLPVIEGMACGTPVIASIHSPLAVTSGRGALLVDPLDESALAAALIKLCTNPEDRRALSAEGQIRAKAYSWKRLAEATINTYRHTAAAMKEVEKSVLPK